MTVLICKWAKPGRCKATVWVRDTLRYTGRTKSGFEMHYNEQQCGRKARASGFCWQHEPRSESVNDRTPEGTER